AHEEAARVAASQRRVGRWLLGAGVLLAVVLVLAQQAVVRWLAAGLPPSLQGVAGAGLAWSAVGVPLALLAALWVTRLQHERDFIGMYASNLVVNAVLIAALALVALAGASPRVEVLALGLGLLAALGARLAWLQWRQRPYRSVVTPPAVALPEASI